MVAAAIATVARAVKRARAGLGGPDRPMGCFLFTGPTGVGKTELARQLAATLGSFKYQIIPGIKTIDQVADDVHQQRLLISTRDIDRSQLPLEVGFINSKGFGGNNASAVVLAPSVVERMLKKRYGAEAFEAWQQRREQTRAAAEAYNQRALKGRLDIIYNFGQNMIDESAISISDAQIQVPGFNKALTFRTDERFKDMLD